MGPALKAAEDQAGKLSKELVRAKAEYDNRVGAREEEEKAKAAVIKAIAEAQEAIQAKEAEIERAGAAHADSQAALQKKEEDITAAERKVKAVSMGMTEVDGEDKTFAEQMREAETAASAASTKAQQASMTADHLKNEIEENKPKGRFRGVVALWRLSLRICAFTLQLSHVNSPPPFRHQPRHARQSSSAMRRM
jgi:predicted  nucleic acid-binding Zn-ribbon protein